MKCAPNRTILVTLYSAGIGTLLSTTLVAQSTVIMGMGNRPLSQADAASFGITTMLVRLGAVAPREEILSPLLPKPVNSLRGFSLRYRDADAPIFSLRPVYSCENLQQSLENCRLLTMIAFQFPNVLRIETCGALRLSLDGTEVDRFPVCEKLDQIKILGAECKGFRFDDPRCKAEVLHSDGTPVTRLKPAIRGEVLVLYAIGLGPVLGLQAGDLSPPGPALLFTTLAHNFELVPPDPRVGVTIYNGLLTPDFVGLAPGQVGLYQINFTVPADLPADIPPCASNNDYSTNATYTIRGRSSQDVVTFCVAPN